MKNEFNHSVNSAVRRFIQFALSISRDGNTTKRRKIPSI